MHYRAHFEEKCTRFLGTAREKMHALSWNRAREKMHSLSWNHAREKGTRFLGTAREKCTRFLGTTHGKNALAFLEPHGEKCTRFLGTAHGKKSTRFLEPRTGKKAPVLLEPQFVQTACMRLTACSERERSADLFYPRAETPTGCILRQVAMARFSWKHTRSRCTRFLGTAHGKTCTRCLGTAHGKKCTRFLGPEREKMHSLSWNRTREKLLSLSWNSMNLSRFIAFEVPLFLSSLPKIHRLFPLFLSVFSLFFFSRR